MSFSLDPNAQPEATGFSQPSRRRLLLQAGHGFGALALGNILARGEPREAAPSLAPPHIHHPPKARRVIQLFMNGGASQLDTFDYKPILERWQGKTFDPGDGQRVESVTGSPGFRVLRSPFEFRQHGQSGRWVSEVFPHLARVVDRLAFILSMHSPTNVHGIGSYLQNTGSVLPGFPCLGAWISYALGRPGANLPDFVVLPDPRGLPYNNLGNFSSGFLPTRHQGTVVSASADPIPFLEPPQGYPALTPASESAGLRLLRSLNTAHLARWPGDPLLEGRIAAYEMAARMQLSVPELFAVDRETAATNTLYGLDDPQTADFGRRCLLARRMVERGVRFVQVWSGPGGPKDNWDNHANIVAELPFMTRQVDRPIAGLLCDLESRGLLEDTLVIWTTEFGRMPFSQGQAGRDHNGGTFVTWLAGAGIRAGSAVGESDEWGWKARRPITCYDLHATLLHLLGIEHELLTFPHNGFDRRLTDVHGTVLREILA